MFVHLIDIRYQNDFDSNGKFLHAVLMNTLP